jgi:hypothetical protein
MVAGDKIHDVIDGEIEKAKAVIVLWSPISVKSDWVRGEAETAHELAKLIPIKIDECKLSINYRGIHISGSLSGVNANAARILSRTGRSASF